MTPTNADLRKFIKQAFTDDALESFCFDYFPEVSQNFGSGMTKNRKIIGLISYCDTNDLLANLYGNLEVERPSLWQKSFGATAVETPRRDVSPSIRDPRQIFLSHATADAEFARRLAADLRDEGWRVWMAPDSIRPGEKWVSAINRGLEESGVFVVVLTPAAVESRWVRTETDEAIAMQHEDLIEFIPLDVASCTLPRLWNSYQRVPFRRSYTTGLDRLLSRLDGEPSPRPAETVRRTASTRDRRIHEKTEIELIHVPAGPFLYGSAESDNMAYDDEKPQRTIELPEYWIGRYPVTNAQFARFVDATGHKTTAEEQGEGRAWTASTWGWIKGADWRHPAGPSTSISGKESHPVVQVSWDDAVAFCQWAGLQLPTEEEWEKAARGSDGKIWPWGDDPPTEEHCNFMRNVGNTTPVGRYSRKGDCPYGCADMAGNVWEWTGSWYDEGRTRALRGGAWGNSDQVTRAAFRDDDLPSLRLNDVGFRVAEHLSDSDS